MTTDFHTHILPPEFQHHRQRHLERDATFHELYANPKARMATADDLLQAMDRDGIDRSVVMGIGWTDIGMAREANDYIVESVRRFPDRLIGFASVNPAWGEEAAREADRYAGAGLRGVGELHPDSQGFDLSDSRTMAPLMEVIRARSLILTTHSSEPVGHMYAGKGRTGPEALWRFITDHPDVTVVCAHWGGGLPFYALMPEVAEALRNVYFDTAASPFLYTAKVFSTVANLVGTDKILFGSDYPLLRAARVLRSLRDARLSPEDPIAITTSNAARLLGK